MAEFKPIEMIMLMEYGSAVADGDVMQVCIKAQPIAELVRCKDCKFHEKDHGCDLLNISMWHMEDFFCAYGEKDGS